MPAKAKEIHLTPIEAEGVLDDLKYRRTDLRNPYHLTDQEKLAVGTVMLKMWIKESKSQRTISEEMNLPLATVNRYINRALQAVVLPTVTEARAEMLQQIDNLLAVWIPKAESGDEKAAAVVAKFFEQRAKITGSFAPIEINQTVTEISATERELQLMITEQEAENKISEDGVELEA